MINLLILVLPSILVGWYAQKKKQRTGVVYCLINLALSFVFSGYLLGVAATTNMAKLAYGETLVMSIAAGIVFLVMMAVVASLPLRVKSEES